MILSSYPKIDLHGMDREYAIFKVKEFIDDCYRLKYEYIVIIHGIGTGILRKTTMEVVKKNRYVTDAKLDFFNPGETIITIKEKG